MKILRKAALITALFAAGCAAQAPVRSDYQQTYVQQTDNSQSYQIPEGSKIIGPLGRCGFPGGGGISYLRGPKLGRYGQIVTGNNIPLGGYCPGLFNMNLFGYRADIPVVPQQNIFIPVYQRR